MESPFFSMLLAGVISWRAGIILATVVASPFAACAEESALVPCPQFLGIRVQALSNDNSMMAVIRRVWCNLSVVIIVGVVPLVFFVMPDREFRIFLYCCRIIAQRIMKESEGFSEGLARTVRRGAGRDFR